MQMTSAAEFTINEQPRQKTGPKNVMQKLLGFNCDSCWGLAPINSLVFMFKFKSVATWLMHMGERKINVVVHLIN